jgi:BirA family biotin operon repressor/biotin-[acetyl-CoA-carboxylase] ligase
VFDYSHFQRAIKTTVIGRHFVAYETVESTMILAREAAAAGAINGTLILAEEQTAGRGRRGRGFHSPAGENLYFTLILRLPPEQHRHLPLAIPLAVCDAVRAEGIDARIKWPNDIWVGERKLSGMLIDAEVESDGRLVAYPGIGINVNGDPTTIPELRAIATSVRCETGVEARREVLLARVCDALEEALSLDAGTLLDRYRASSLLIGRAVRVAPSGADSYEGIAEGIADDGSLVVRGADGTLRTLLAGEVSLRPAASA